MPSHEFMTNYYIKAELLKAYYAALRYGNKDIAETAYRQLERLR